MIFRNFPLARMSLPGGSAPIQRGSAVELVAVGEGVGGGAQRAEGLGRGVEEEVVEAELGRSA